MDLQCPENTVFQNLCSLRMLKGTLMQIWKSANTFVSIPSSPYLRLHTFVSIWKGYVEDFSLKQFLLSEICAREIRDTFVYKHSEKQQMLKISLLFKKFTNFTGE